MAAGYCTQCGAELGSDARFCGKCGRAVGQAPPPIGQFTPTDRPTRCSKCQAIVPAGNVYCPRCGVNVVASVAPATTEAAASQSLAPYARPYSASTAPYGSSPSVLPASYPPQAYRAQPTKSPGVAAVLSFFWCGLGQIYNGEIGKGVLMLGAYVISWLLMFVLIGLVTTPILWIWGMVDAYRTAERFNLAGRLES
jgi:TM2 domain-containing membrane protein YozV/RNA polymerase subunit RPABC4/transcription elongation factor Spt4